MASSQIFPSQTIPQKDKTPEWCSLHLDYAQNIWRGSNSLRDKMDKDFLSYNGIKQPDSINILTKTFGKANKAKYIAYRAHKPKIQLMVGEFLMQPLAATVETTNRDAKSEKMAKMDMMYGAMIAKKELEQLRDKVGVDVLEGAPIPESEDDPLWNKISPKDKEETIMQIVLNDKIIEDDIKIKFSEDVLNTAITSMCYGKIERNEQGETHYISVDPRDAIFEEIKGDIFLEKSPLHGACFYMSTHDVLRKFELTPEQVALVNSIAQNPTDFLRRNNNMGVKMVGGNLMIQVMHIEWKSVIPTYFKKLKKTATQLAFDSSEPFIYIELNTEEYEKNKDWHDKQVAKGSYEIIVKYAEDLWEATRIGGVKELDVNRRRALFIPRKVDDPTRIIGGSYVGFLCQTVDGKRISLMNELENLSNVFDIVMYKILQDINKYSGKSLGFNKAALSSNSSVKEVMYNLINDGFITYDTSATGNMHGRDVSLNNIIQTEDIGLSDTFPSLIAFKNDLLAMMDRMTGINENREGQISASATVSNTDQAITASRTITAPFFYGLHLYMSKVLNKLVESEKLTLAFYKIEKGEQILGTEKFRYLQVTQEVGYKDYGVHIQDGSKYSQVNAFMKGLMEASLNAKEITQADALKFMLAETFAEKKAILEDAEAKVKEILQSQQQAQLQSQQQMQQAQLQQQLELRKAEIEDAQAHDLEKINVQADADIRVKKSEMSDQLVLNQHKFSNENINNQNF